MKQFTLLIMVTLSLAGTVWAQQTGTTTNSPAYSPPLGGQPVSASPHGTSQISITPDEWQELRAARNAAIQANPDLIAENKKLLERMRALQDKVDALMIKTDPSIAPIIAKFEANRPHLGTPAAPPSAKK